MLLRTLLLICVVFLTACSNFDLDQHADMRPELKPESFFNGYLTAHGVVKNRSGQVTRYFNADIHAEWTDGVGTFSEVFWFDDGEQQERVWVFKPEPDNSYIATAGDVIGEGVAQTAGNAMSLNYTLRVPYDGDYIDLSIKDRMYLINENTLISESAMMKFGFDVGEVLLVIKKH